MAMVLSSDPASLTEKSSEYGQGHCVILKNNKKNIYLEDFVIKFRSIYIYKYIRYLFQLLLDLDGLVLGLV